MVTTTLAAIRRFKPAKPPTCALLNEIKPRILTLQPYSTQQATKVHFLV